MTKKKEELAQHTQGKYQKKDATPWYKQQVSGVWLLAAVVLIIFLIGWLAWTPVSNWLADTGLTSNRQSAERIAPTELVVTTDGDGNLSRTSEQPQVTVNTNGGAGGASGSGGAGGSSGGTGSTGGGSLIDLAESYNEIESGDTYSQVSSLIGDPKDCIQTLLAVIGLQKVCTWSSDGTSMIVTFIDDTVVSKTSIGL